MISWWGHREDEGTGAITLFYKTPRYQNMRYRLALTIIRGTSALLGLVLVPGSEKVRSSRLSPGFEVPQRGESR